MYITAGRFLTLTLNKKTVGNLDYSLELYSSIDSISRHLLEFSEEQMQERLETEFDIYFYPLEKDPDHDLEKNSANEYMRAGFGISSLIAVEYLQADEVFFQERSQDFTEFYRELGDYGSGHESKHLTQYVNLYKAIAEAEGIYLDPDPSSIILQNLEEKKETVLEMFDEFEKKL